MSLYNDVYINVIIIIILDVFRVYNEHCGEKTLTCSSTLISMSNSSLIFEIVVKSELKLLAKCVLGLVNVF